MMQAPLSLPHVNKQHSQMLTIPKTTEDIGALALDTGQLFSTQCGFQESNHSDIPAHEGTRT